MKPLPVRTLSLLFLICCLLLPTATHPLIAAREVSSLRGQVVADTSHVAEVPSDWKSYEDPVWKLSIQYPPDWQITAIPYRGFGVRFSSPDLEVDDLGGILKGSYFWLDVTIVSTGGSTAMETHPLEQGAEVTWVTDGVQYVTRFMATETSSTSSIQEMMLGSLSLSSAPNEYPLLPLDMTALNATLKLPFPSGSGVIPSGGGYNNSDRHKRFDKFGLDFCTPGGCTRPGNYAIAPTDLVYLQNASNQTDYHFFEVQANTSTQFKLCMSLGHFDFGLLTVERGDTFPRGAVLGPLSGYIPSHWHMAMWAVAPAGNCVGVADGDYTAIPYLNLNIAAASPTPNGDFRLEGQSYSECEGGNCVNVHANKPVTSTNSAFCYNPAGDATDAGPLSPLTADFNPADCFSGTGSNVDVVLIIDSSGSMYSNDPANKRLDAGKAYLTASLAGDFVSVVDFDQSARLASQLKRLPENKDTLIAAINTIDSSGYTDIGEGIQTACAELRSARATNTYRAAILLTDGRNEPDPYNGQHSCFVDAGWPIYTFGFGDADDVLLDQIATSTRGEYKRLPTSNLVCEFQAVRAKIAGQTPGPCTAYTIEPDETIQFPIDVGKYIAKATFSISWPGSDIELSLISPSGRLIERSTNSPDVEHDLGVTYETYGIANPEEGEWQVSLFGADVSTGGEEVVFNHVAIADPSPEPEPPQNFAASDGLLLAQVRLTWTQSDGAMYYEIYQSVPGTNNWTYLQTREGQYNFTDDSTNDDGTVLEYAAKACSDAGCSVLSNTDTGYADMPVLYDIINDGSNTYEVEWAPANTASHHEVQENHNGAGWIPIYSGSDTVINRAGQASGEWCYQVRGYNGIQLYSPWTEPKCTTVTNGPTGSFEALLPAILYQEPPSVVTNPLLNGNFESGPGVGWHEYSSQGYALVVDTYLGNAITPHSGAWGAWLGGLDNETSILSQEVIVPTDQPVLSYYYAIGSADDCGYDFAIVIVNDHTVYQYALCDDRETDSWVHQTVSLAAYAGQTVVLKFLVTTDDSLNSNLFLDDVEFVSARAATTDAQPATPHGPTLAEPKDK